MNAPLSHFLHPYVELWKQIVVSLFVCFFAVFAPRFANRWFQSIERSGSRIARRKRLALGLVFLTPIVVRVLLLPLIPPPVPEGHDEHSYILQSDTFAHGRLTNPTHPLWMSFETFHVNWLPTYHSIFPPAQGFLLAAGQLLGNPWIGVVLSVGVMCAAVCWMLQAWMPARWALLGALMAICNLGTVSYWMDSYWGGAVAAIGGALVLGALPRLLGKPKVRYSLLLGLGMAILANSRPLEGFIFCLPVVAILLFRLRAPGPVRTFVPQVFLPLGVVLLLTVTFAGYYNWRLTGDPRMFPHYLNFHTYFSSPLFIWQHARPPLHYNNPEFANFYQGPLANGYHASLQDVVRESWHKLSLTWSVFLWTGAMPALLFLPLTLRDRRIRLLIGEFALCALGLFSVVYFEPHYAAPLTCVIYALLVQSVRHLRCVRWGGRRVGVALSRAVVILLVLTAMEGPYRLIRYPKSPYAWSWNRGSASANPIAEQLEAMPGKQLVVVRYDAGHNPNAEWVYNLADIDGSKIVWARELDAQQNQELVDYFKDRKIWLLEPDRKPLRLLPYR